MKKLLYSILALAGVTMASCTQEHVEVQYIPGNVVAPILGDIGDLQLKEGNSDITIDYVKADFGLPAVSADVLYVSVSEDMSSKRRVNAKFEDGVITVTNLDLNTAINNAGATPEEATQAYFAIISSLVTDKGAIISNSEVMSNIVSANVTPFLSEIIPSLKYGKMYVVGSFNNWDHPTVEQNFDFLYDYEGNGQYSGIIDFRAPGAIEFKLTAGAWGVEEHSMSGPHDDEASTITLVAGGGSNIDAWGAKRFYGATFDKSGLTLKKSWSADQIGIVGDFNGWADGADVVMQWNPKWGRFYADIELSTDTKLKFRADGGWDLNWGADCAVGGDNIAVAAGNYRVYFNPMNGFIEFNTMQYGKEEDITGGNTGGGGNEEPEPTPTPTGDYGLVGSFNGWGSSDDLLLEEYQNGYLYYTGATFEANTEFKVRFYNDGTWNSEGDYALEKGASTVIGEAMTLKHGGDSDNLKVETAGTYDIYFNPTACIMYVMVAGDVPELIEPEPTPSTQYGLVGSFNGWGSSDDLLLEEYQNGYLYYTGATFEANTEFKVRFYNDGTWNSEGDYALEKGASTVIGEAMTLKHGGDSDNLKVETAGTYDFYFNPTTCIMYVMEAGNVPAI